MDDNKEIESLLLFHSAVLILKTMAMSLLTACYRMKNKVIATPEDAFYMPTGRCVRDDPEVERVRRTHRNDLENIPIFLAAAYIYGMHCNPSVSTFAWHMRIFTVCRIAHTIITVSAVRQPYRSILWTVAWTVCLSVCAQIIQFSYDSMGQL
ncbi:microsomal glutathione S-transferase 1-like [Symsagittifera roscoffensis]|uniref:microsomal glutathione S-transferase 1-like n=1 Tax=Symsagittifera roscoffensis TaxID=84072 RepID=UPI00307BB112